MLISSFDEASFGSADAMKQTVQIVARGVEQAALSDPPGLILVTSAKPDVKGALREGAQKAASGDGETYQAIEKQMWDSYRALARQLIQHPQKVVLLQDLIERYLYEFKWLCRCFLLIGELNMRGFDVISSIAERMSAALLAAVMRTHGFKAEFVDASEIIITDDSYGYATPIMPLTEPRCCDRLLPMLHERFIPVVTGCTGATQHGALTTLGGGGSNYTAAIIGAALDAQEVEIWADDHPVLRVNPQAVLNTRRLEQSRERLGNAGNHPATHDDVEDVVILSWLD